MFFHVFGHINANHGVFTSENGLCQCFGKLGLADTGRTKEQERTDWTFRIFQSDTASLEVASGTSDAAVIDSLMAAAMIGEGTSYADLTYTVALNSEKYGVGFRKGSDLAAVLDEFFANATADGSMKACAEKYGVQAALVQE